ncbi:MAG: SRPBCC family protein [Candidatus Longimicrobiales bacterium M2_2A_002]
MTQTRVKRTIDAPADRVFRVIADIREYSQAQPDIVGVEFLSDRQYGVGTRFREIRRMGKREATTELEVTELSLVMEARPHRLLARITTPLMAGMLRKALEKDMDAVKAYCESGLGPAPDSD